MYAYIKVRFDYLKCLENHLFSKKFGAIRGRGVKYIAHINMVVKDEMDTSEKSWNKTNMRIKNNYFVYTLSVVKKYYTNRKTIKKVNTFPLKKKKKEINQLNLFVLHDQDNENCIRFVKDFVRKVLLD